jgi:hypothetical protein
MSPPRHSRSQGQSVGGPLSSFNRGAIPVADRDLDDSVPGEGYARSRHRERLHSGLASRTSVRRRRTAVSGHGIRLPAVLRDLLAADVHGRHQSRTRGSELAVSPVRCGRLPHCEPGLPRHVRRSPRHDGLCDVANRSLAAAKDIEYPNSFVERLKRPAGDLDRILTGNAKRLLHL